MATLKVLQSEAVKTPVFAPPTEAKFVPAQIFENVQVSKTWDLNAIRGGKFGIGWTMNQKLWPDADKVDYPLGKPQKIVFKNSSSRLHPMHIHGVFFRVLERNGQKAVESFTRDTVLVGPRESVTIGFVPEHPGIWLTHCHIQSHAEAGMMTTVEVKN
jgi:FtsP/CotA-like multicopper oxidase with cupredoxin domain